MKFIKFYTLMISSICGLLACSNGCKTTTSHANITITEKKIGFSSNKKLAPEILTKYNVGVSEGRQYVCSGTVIMSTSSKTQVLTACHCITDTDSGKIYDYSFVWPGDGESYRFKVLKYNRELDMTLLESEDKMPIQPYAVLANSEPKLGNEVWTVGNPLSYEDMLSKGIISKIIPERKNKKKGIVLFDAVTWKGSSGGGVFNKNFELIGVEVGMLASLEGQSSLGWSFATRLEDIKKFLDIKTK